MNELQHALRGFVAAYHARSELVAEQRDWDCAIRLLAEDSGATLDLRIRAGRVEEHGADTPPDLVVRADATVLLDILEFRRDPNEPYLFGELLVEGPEAHFLRLDYVVSRLCQ